MNELATRLRTRATELFNGFTTGQKAVFGLAVVFVIVGGYLFTGWAAKPSYSPLYTDLDSADAAAVTEELTSAGVSYKLADGGRTVMVPKGELYDQRIALSGKGLPSSGNSGFALLDKQGITASEFRQRVDFQRALSGELATTIESIEDVQSATVNLVIPEEDLFASDDQKASASVLVQTKANATLAPGTVQSILHLVSSSVEGLTPANVTISDTDGTLLIAPGEDGINAAMSVARAQQTVEYERQVAAKVKELLAAVVGSKGVVVQVKAELDFDKRETTVESFENPDGVVAQESTSEETLVGTEAATTGGVLGTDPTAVTIPGGTSDFSKTEESTVFAPSKTTESTTAAPGTVKRQTVSVFIDSNANSGVALGDIQQQVEAAAGIDAARGDLVRVSEVQFNTAEADAAEEAAKAANASAKWDSTMDTVRSVVTLLVVGIGMLIGYRRLRGAARREELIPLDHLALGPGDDDVLELDDDDWVELEPAMAGGGGVVIEGDDEPSTVLVNRRHRTELDRLPGMEERMAAHADIADLIDRQPDDVAQLLRSWMSERR